jgi:tRNA-specific 2-thiouridylase
MKERNSQKTVFVGLSGGVDSSVAAARLLKEGYHVTGVFIKVWNPSFLTCNWEKERLDAMRVCATLGIPFLTCDATEQYKTSVVEYLILEYKAGRTPNPDVMCNKQVKFGAFLDFADMHGADYIATGHYAERRETKEGSQLLRGKDATKDQSYFLWTLTREKLARTLFPVGDSLKKDIRKEAAEYGLPTAEKPDSQGVCFLGELDMKEFLLHFIPREVGKVVDVSGAIVGEHDGAYFYTIGQRHGFRLHQASPSEEPYYIVSKNIEQNTLTVSHKKPARIAAVAQTLTLSDTNWIGKAPKHEAEIQTRYRQKPVSATIEITGTTSAIVTPLEALEAPALGQSCVVYDGPTCHGGGIISQLS